MKKLLFIFLLIFSSQSFAEWKKIPQENAYDEIYVDLENIRESDGYIFFWLLFNYPIPMDAKGIEFQSTVVYFQADCHLFRAKRLHFSAYSQLFGKGRELTKFENKEDWVYAKPGRYTYTVLKTVCD